MISQTKVKMLVILVKNGTIKLEDIIDATYRSEVESKLQQQ